MAGSATLETSAFVQKLVLPLWRDRFLYKSRSSHSGSADFCAKPPISTLAGPTLEQKPTFPKWRKLLKSKIRFFQNGFGCPEDKSWDFQSYVGYPLRKSCD